MGIGVGFGFPSTHHEDPRPLLFSRLGHVNDGSVH